ncbi:hypothetical protein BTR25_11220 [Bacillus sp. MRMR6]|nr:hypothetical protein BTR25_11220 [Bacillus sp. MRMR6]
MFMLGGCSNVPKGEEDVFPPSMNAVIHINGTDYPMEEGNYEWSRKKGLETEVVQTDHASPNQMADNIEPILLTSDQKVEIKIEDNPDISVYLWNDQGREKTIETQADQFTIPSAKGKYIYEVLAKWKNGTVSYTFVIEVE